MIRMESGRFGRLKYWLLSLMVRLGRLRRVEMNKAELDAMLKPHLPLHFSISIPNGKGRINVIEATTSLPGDDQIQTALLCEFKVDVLGNPLYQAHLLITLCASPTFDKPQGMLRAKNIRLLQTHLVKDNYAAVKDAREVFTKLLPGPLSSMVNLGIDLSISSAMSMLENSLYGDLSQYLKLYINGSKQRILDYHKGQIEQQLLAYLEQHKPEYKLDNALLDERLFAEYGQQVRAEKQVLAFLF
ncbi:hypothetical protein [Lacimicrobium alkaliphilum]|nr:hypothetical protein [Lacimicrobium alkaliphilum]